MAGLQVHHLRKAFGRNAIVDDVTFEVAEGEFFVLLGPSGGGKTTVLRLICGLEKADSGTILIDEQEITDLPPRERNIGMVFQEYGLYPSMNVFQNIAYGLEARGMKGEEVKERVTQAAELLDLSTMLNNSIVDMSGGEQQRVALARAMAKDASVYLFDEPLSNLDAKLRYRTRRHITDIHRRKCKPSVYVTHDQGEALAMADRIGVMAKGRLQQIGTPEQLLDEPANMFVARFMGSPPMNLISGTVSIDEHGYAVSTPAGQVRLDRDWKPVLNSFGERAVVLGIRPDRLKFAANGSAGLAAEVEEVEALIGETSATFTLASGERLAGLFAEGADNLTTGQVVHLDVNAGGIELFDPETERSLRST
ncbi:MAG: ABC transporter ATP-binding protein [Thermomicrobiales bacterium]